MWAALSLGLTKVGGSILQGAANYQAGRNAESISLLNQAISEQDAESIESISRLRAIQNRRLKEKFTSSQRAAYAKGGVELEGSPVDVMAADAGSIEMDNLIEQYNYRVAAARARTDARVYKNQAKQYRRAALLSAASSFLDAGSGAATTINDYVGNKGK